MSSKGYSVGGPSSIPSLPAMDYLEISPYERRRKRSDGTNRAIKLLASTPLDIYSDASVTLPQRSKLVKAILGDLLSDDCTWHEEDRISAFKVVKELSRLPGSSECLATTESLRSLIASTKKESTALSNLSSPNEAATSLATTSTEGLDLVLRVLNNVLYQHSESREEFATLGGLKLSLNLIKEDGSAIITFLAARIVFFSTVTEAVVVKEAVEQMQLVEIFVKRTEALMQAGTTSEVDQALEWLQKAFFNVGLYYPRVANNERVGKAIVGEKFHEALLPFLAPTIRLVVSHPGRSPASLAPPITNAIAVLLNYPVSPYRHIWSDCHYPSEPLKKGSNSSERAWSASTAKAKRMATTLFGKNSSSSSSSSSQNRSSSPQSLPQSNSDFINTLINFLDEFLLHYFTTLDPDGEETGKLARKDEIDVQEYAEPALLLLRRLVDEVTDFRQAVKSRILSSDIDRSQGLDKRMDLTGTLIRLMSSTVYPRLARASGEVLLAVCDGKSSEMTAEIGYGPCAGFLMSIGQLHSLPSGSSTNKSGRNIDPITGKVLPTPEEMAKQDEEAGTTMTEEEKEAEAEKLFSLFDRLDRTGVVKVQNPMRQGVESGRIRQVEDNEEELERLRIEADDLETETTVEREMKAFREKQRRSRG